MDEYIDCPYCKSESLAEEFRSGAGHCPVCGRANYEMDGYMNHLSYRTADQGGNPSDSSGASPLPSNSNPAAPYQNAGQLGIAGDPGVPADMPYSSLNIGGDGVSDGGFNQADGSARGPGGPLKIQVSDPAGPSIERSNADPVGTLNGVDTGGTFVGDPTGGMLSGPYLTDMAPQAPSSGGGYNGGSLTNPAPAQQSGGSFKDAPPKTSSLRTAAIDFLAGQNTADRGELLFRAHRHASDRTGQLPVPAAQRVVQAFVAAVHREITAGGAPEGGRKKSHRTAAVVADFPDELMF